MDDELVDRVVRMAWEDRTSFDEIERKTGLSEGDVIKVMRRNLKASSFRCWRKRVSGRRTKHARVFREDQKALAKNSNVESC